MAQPVEFKKTREFGELIGDTFLFLKQNFKPLAKALLYLCGLFIVAGILTSILSQMNLLDYTRGEMRSPIYARNTWARILSWQYFLSMIFAMAYANSLYVTILSYLTLYIEKGNVAPSLLEVWGYYKYYFFRLLGSSFLLTIFFVICLACCLVPGIYIFPMISIFYPVMIMENAGFRYTFNRSFKLVKNEWWVSAAVILIIWIIAYALALFIQIPSFAIMMISTLTHAERPFSNAYIILNAIGSYLSYIFFSIPVITSTLIYYNLVEKKENSGLMERIGNLGSNTGAQEIDAEEY